LSLNPGHAAIKRARSSSSRTPWGIFSLEFRPQQQQQQQPRHSAVHPINASLRMAEAARHKGVQEEPESAIPKAAGNETNRRDARERLRNAAVEGVEGPRPEGSRKRPSQPFGTQRVRVQLTL
jgi:hypothetical protein